MRRWCPASHRRLVFLTVAVLSAATARGAHGDDEQVAGHAELGVEYDSNVHRVEQIPGTPGTPVASPLARAVAGWSAADRVGDSQDVAFSLLGATKVFTAPAARSENVGIVESSGAWRVAAGARTRLGLNAAYYEAVQSGTPAERALALAKDPSVEARDFRSLTPSLGWLRALDGAGSLRAAAGYRWFVYKPLPSYDFEAPVLALEYHLDHETADGAADWELAASAGVELRRFAGTRLVSQPAGCTPGACTGAPDPAGARHVDQFFSGQVDVTRTGPVLIGAGYALQWNRSNSFTESLLRHVGAIRFTAPLPGAVYLAARAELVYVTYPDQVPLVTSPSGQPTASIEEETRSQVRIELSRTLRPHLQLLGRYSFYANALGQGTYRRQTASLSVVYTTD